MRTIRRLLVSIALLAVLASTFAGPTAAQTTSGDPGAGEPQAGNTSTTSPPSPTTAPPTSTPTTPIAPEVAPAPQIVGPKIVGGSGIPIEDAPYQARLFRNLVFSCGGSVIDSEWVLTAAHCVSGVAIGQLLVGVNSASRGSGGDYSTVSQVLVHPGWDDVAFINDIALLRLTTPVTATPIEIVSAADASVWEPGDGLFATGFGSIVEGGPTSSTLQGVVVPRVSDAVCALLEDGSEPGFPPFDASGHLCAGELAGGKDACQGDSGGPLASTEGTAPVLVGIVSWGYGCARPNHPGVYTRVDAYRDWVNAVLEWCTPGQCSPVPPAGFAMSNVTVNGTYEPLVGDFDGDSARDVLWYRPGSATDWMWFGDPTRAFQSSPFTANGTYKTFTGDFDGNGVSDVFWYRPGSGADYIWWGSTSGTFTSQRLTVNGSYEPLTGDFDGDGEWDIFWYRAGPGADYVWWGSAGRTFASSAKPVNGTYQPFSGDFGGDGEWDIFWYGPGSASDWIWSGTPGRDFTSTATSIGGSYQPFTGFLNADDRSDIVWNGPGSAADMIWYATGPTSFSSTSIDVDDGFVGLAGDFDANGTDEVFWYRPGTGFDTIWWAA